MQTDPIAFAREHAEAAAKIPTEQLRALAESSERAAEHFAREGREGHAAFAWFLWQVYRAELTRRYPPLRAVSA